MNYFDYVSELRSNLFFAKTKDFSLRIYAVKKETPYVADGIPQECSPRFEAYMVAPSGDKIAEIHFQIDGKTYGGEMSYDNVKREYYYFRTLDVSDEVSIPCVIKYGDEEFTLTANSVVEKELLSPQTALHTLTTEYAKFFSSMTDKYGFAGEIYLRLIYEDAPYYYIGVIDRAGKIHAFLLNGHTGKILARREG